MSVYNKRTHSYPRTAGLEDVAYPLWMSESKKKANDYAVAKDYMDYFDQAHEVCSERIRRINENWDLHAGRWPQIQKVRPKVNIQLGQETIQLGTGNLNHYPIIDRVSKSVVSDLIIRPIIPIIRDNSSKARNHRERVQLERVQSFFQQTIIQPGLQRITQEYDLSNGVIDPISLTIDEQRQREADIERRFREETPEEILSYMERMNTPDELVADSLLKEAIRYTNAKQKFWTGAENAVVTGEEYYRIDIINGMPNFEVLNPKWVVWGGSSDVEYVEDGTFAKYEQYLDVEDVISKYSHHLKPGDIKRLSDLYSEIPGYGNDKRRDYKQDGIQRRVVDLFADNPELQNEIDPKTRDGQQKLMKIYANLGRNSRQGWGIRESYITWKWTRKVKFVTRVVNGVLETFIRDSHYRKDPFAGDIEVIEKAIPQVYRGTKLGGEFYLDVGPKPNQYDDINNPTNVKLCIYGGKYNTFQNNTKNASLIDLGKPWQYKYNTLVKKMEENQATDIGKVFLGTTSMKPKKWTWAQWYQSLFVGKMALISNHRQGTNQLDTTLFRQIDLSRTDTIAQDIQQLEYFENKIITSMYYSPQKIGDISQYATNVNTQMAIQGVDRQMYRFHNKNRIIKENALNGLLKVALYAYKDNERVKSVVLDDFLKAHYELNFNTADASSFHLTVVDDFQESQKLEQMRNLALTFLQNGMTGGQLAAITNATSMAEITQYLKDADKKVEKQQQEAFQREQSLIEQNRQATEQQLLLSQQFQAEEAERDRQVKLRLGEINSLLMQNAQDVDRNKVNDSLERAMLEIESRERIEASRQSLEEKLKTRDQDLESRKIDKINSK